MVKLEKYVDRSGGAGACWPWTRSCIVGFGSDENSKRGYGQIGGSWTDNNGEIRRWHWLTHRAAKSVELGRLLIAEECVLHRCDNPPCCNPAHTFIGTRADNCDDKMKKGRHNYRTHHGSKHGMAKVTEEIVREMRSMYAARTATQTGLAERFGLTQATVWAILHRKTWAHVE